MRAQGSSLRKSGTAHRAVQSSDCVGSSGVENLLCEANHPQLLWTADREWGGHPHHAAGAAHAPHGGPANAGHARHACHDAATRSAAATPAAAARAAPSRRQQSLHTWPCVSEWANM